MKYALLDDDLISTIASAPETEQGRWLILEPHTDFEGHWEVNSLSHGFMFDFRDIIGQYRVVSPASLEQFLAKAEEGDYRVAFGEEPTRILDAYRALDEPPPLELNSTLPGTVKGMLPFQVQGFNFLKDKSGMAVWSTGTGKSVLASALIRYHLDRNDFTIAWFVVKAHNKINVARTLKRLVGIDALVIDGTPYERSDAYRQLRINSIQRIPTVVVLNYEKFRDDLCRWDKYDRINLDPEREDILNVPSLFIWDEMPTKLSNRGTKLYHAVCHCLYDNLPPKVIVTKQRAETLHQYALSATPIENEPEGVFNCVRLMVPNLFGPVNEFRKEYVASYNFWDSTRPESWHNLDKMSLKMAGVCHQVDKADPDIAAQFPEALETPMAIEWAPQHREVYDRLVKLAKEQAKLAKEDPEEHKLHVLGLIGVFQMLCDAPSMVNNSAAFYEAYAAATEAFSEGMGPEPIKKGSETALRLLRAIGEPLTDAGHTKLETLARLLRERHPDEKVVLFTALNTSIMPVLEAALTEWGISYVRYDGTTKQKQAAQDAFKNDPDIRVFLSSDKGSDSIDLEEGSVVIHYDLPWKWSTLVQRQNRIHRITSGFKTVYYYTLLMANSVEDRKRDVIVQKQAYHKAVFGGAVANQSLSARMSREDLMYVLLGELADDTGY